MRVPIIALSLVTLVAASQSSVYGQESSLDSLLRATASYVARYERDLTQIISHERQRQSTTMGFLTRTRILDSEFAFWPVPEDQVWLGVHRILGVRNVQSVDGQRVRDSRARLEQALHDPESVRQLQAESERYDIGTIVHTTDDPTLMLQCLSAVGQDRLNFTDGGTERVAGMTTRKVDFRERATPTIITINGKEAFASGAVWLREDGTIVRTNIDYFAEGVRVLITVDFSHDPKLDLWVPTRMDGQYQALAVTRRTRVTSTYDNYHRFETGGRIVVPDTPQ